MVLVSNRTCHHKQQWNSSQLLRSSCVHHGVPVDVYIFMHVCTLTHIQKYM